MTIHPKRQQDLLLAPVAAEVDLNLQRLRERSVRDVGMVLELELDRPAMQVDSSERRALVLRQALRNVDMHGWTAAITDDGTRVHLDGGSVTLDLGLSATVERYLREGVAGSDR